MSGKRNAAEWMKAKIKNICLIHPEAEKDRQQKLRKTQIHAERTAWIYFSMFYWIIQDVCEKLCEKHTKTGFILTLIFSTGNL